MNGSSRTRLLMAVAVFVLFGAVLLDRTGLLAAGAATGESPSSARTIYLAHAELLAKQQALVGQSAAWRAAASDASAVWDDIRPRVIREQSRQIAEETLRERVRGIASGLDVSAVSAKPVKRTEDAKGSVQLIELRLEFLTTNPATAYELIDRVENAQNLLADVSRIELTGPGLKQIPEQVNASINIRALALIEPGA